MNRTGIGRWRARANARGPVALSPDPPDPDTVLAEALARTAFSGKAAGT
jgi:hypothetical protein